MDARDLADLPGGDLLAAGLADLARGVRSKEALLVAIGAPRLRNVGVALPDEATLPARPEHALYALLASEGEPGAHSRYNALVRRLVSLERALEFRVHRERRRRE